MNLDVSHNKLHNIPSQKFLDGPEHLSKLFINNNELQCFLNGERSLKPSNKASKLKSKILGIINNKCHIMMTMMVMIIMIIIIIIYIIKICVIILPAAFPPFRYFCFNIANYPSLLMDFFVRPAVQLISVFTATFVI